MYIYIYFCICVYTYIPICICIYIYTYMHCEERHTSNSYLSNDEGVNWHACSLWDWCRLWDEVRYSLFVSHCSLLIVRYSLFVTHCSLLIVRYSLFVSHCTRSALLKWEEVYFSCQKWCMPEVRHVRSEALVIDACDIRNEQYHTWMNNTTHEWTRSHMNEQYHTLCLRHITHVSYAAWMTHATGSHVSHINELRHTCEWNREEVILVRLWGACARNSTSGVSLGE